MTKEIESRYNDKPSKKTKLSIVCGLIVMTILSAVSFVYEKIMKPFRKKKDE
jgi:uncharacterized protein YpmB